MSNGKIFSQSVLSPTASFKFTSKHQETSGVIRHDQILSLNMILNVI